MDEKEFITKWYTNIRDALLSAGAPSESIKDFESLPVTEKDNEDYWKQAETQR